MCNKSLRRFCDGSASLTTFDEHEKNSAAEIMADFCLLFHEDAEP